jgi:tRNA(Ile)-lysidine synthase
VSLVRPLLDVSREQIRRFAETEGIPWREDPSNRDPCFDRARLRTEVMPLLQEKFPGATPSLARAAQQMRAYVDHTLTPALEERLETAYEECGTGGRLALDALRDEAPVWRRRLILAALDRALPQAPQTAAFAREVADLIDAQVGRRVEGGEGTIWRTRRGLRFLPSAAAPTPISSPVSVPVGEAVAVETGTIRVDVDVERPESLADSPTNVEYVDADRLTAPLVLRTWRTGDRIRPLGLDGTKPVADVLTDARVPPHRREVALVLLVGEEPAWIVGYRLDHRLRVRPSTTRVGRLSWDPREKASDDCNSP